MGRQKIEEVVDSITKMLEATDYAKADRLQKVLEELVKVEIAAIEGKRS